jgi:hypothetical protein
MTRYLSGLGVSVLGLCGGGWLVVAAVAFGGESAGRAERVNLLTGAVLIAVCCLSLVCWTWAWRRRMRADGVLADRFPLASRREARRNRRALIEGMHGTGVRGAEASSAGGNPGERAAELVSELRSMLEPLPQRTRFASDFRPRVSVTSVPTLIPRARPAPMSIPRLTSASDCYRPGPVRDGEDTW